MKRAWSTAFIMKNPNEKKIGTVAMTYKVGISAERLRYWEKLGVVHPSHVRCGTRKFRRYSQGDIRRTTLVKFLVDGEKYSLEGAIRKLAQEK
jgi:DNA-binding transcriptional MerR regulator